MKLTLLTFCLATLFLFKSNAQSFKYYYGNIHSQSSYSDGNKDSATSLITKPLQDFNYAKLSLHTDFYGISDHNHLNAGMTSPSHFHMGIADANTANNDGAFVALYGQEWGVISGGGHVIVYGYDSLMGWDAGDYDVFVAQNNYAGLWTKINAKAGAFAYLAHPNTTDYTNLFTTAVSTPADNAIIGMAGRSGPAFSTNTTYSNPSTSDHLTQYQEALSKGYHLGIGLDHDTHNSVFGRQTAGRLVVLAPALTRSNVLYAFRKMNFYCSDDWNANIDFNINSQPMGSVYTHSTIPTLNVTVTDPDGEATSSISVYYGIPGSSSLPTVLTSNSNSNTLNYTHTITNGTTYYYYLEIIQADGDKIWTSPIWYTYNNAYTANAPVTNFSVSATNNCVGQPISLTDLTGNTPTAWNWTMLGATTPSSTVSNPTVTYTTAGTYYVTLLPTNATGTGLPFTQTITVINSPTVSVTSASICSGQAAVLTATGASSYVWNTSAVTSTVSVSPIVTTQYTVTGTSGSCSKTATTTVVVGAGPPVVVSSNTICPGQSASLSVSGASTYTWSTGANTSTITVTPATSTQYSVTGAVSGCSKTVTTSVIVNPSPTVAVVSNPTSLCSGQTAVISASGASSYVWNTSATTTSISVSPTVTTQYTVTGTSAGCTNTATTSVVVGAGPPLVVSSNTICPGQSSSLSVSGASTYTWSTGANTSSITVTPATSTQYSVTGAVGSCIKTVTTSVTVNPNPVVTITSNTTALCSGQAAAISASGASSYVWNTGATTASISVTPAVTAQYTITGTSGGCSKTVTTSVIVNPSPTVAVVSNPTSVCSGQTAVISASGASSYVWNTGATTTSISVSPTVSTQYTVTGTSAGCTNTATTSVVIGAGPPLVVSSNTICPGQSASLSVSGASTYTWSTGANTSAITVTPATSTQYSVTGAVGSCIKTVTTSVTVNPTPTVTILSNPTSLCSGQTAVISANGASSYLWNTSSTASSISVTPSVTTQYTVTGTSGGCSKTATINVVVSASPMVMVSTNTICQGQSASLSASGATTYTWSTGATGSIAIVTPVISTQYSVTGTTGGCSKTTTTSVVVNPSPVLTAVSSASSICAGQSATLTVTGASTYTWNTGANTAGITVNPFVTTTYTVYGTGSNACSTAISITQPVSVCTGLEIITGADAGECTLYPNPTEGKFTVNVTHFKEKCFIEIYNCVGERVSQMELIHSKTSIDLSNYDEGIYFVKFTIEGKTISLIRVAKIN